MSDLMELVSKAAVLEMLQLNLPSVGQRAWILTRLDALPAVPALTRDEAAAKLTDAVLRQVDKSDDWDEERRVILDSLYGPASKE